MGKTWPLELNLQYRSHLNNNANKYLDSDHAFSNSSQFAEKKKPSSLPWFTEVSSQDEIARIRKRKRGRNMLNRSGNTTDNLCFRYRFRDVFSRFRCCVYNGTGPLFVHVSVKFQLTVYMFSLFRQRKGAHPMYIRHKLSSLVASCKMEKTSIILITSEELAKGLFRLTSPPKGHDTRSGNQTSLEGSIFLFPFNTNNFRTFA